MIHQSRLLNVLPYFLDILTMISWAFLGEPSFHELIQYQMNSAFCNRRLDPHLIGYFIPEWREISCLSVLIGIWLLE